MQRWQQAFGAMTLFVLACCGQMAFADEPSEGFTIFECEIAHMTDKQLANIKPEIRHIYKTANPNERIFVQLITDGYHDKQSKFAIYKEKQGNYTKVGQAFTKDSYFAIGQNDFYRLFVPVDGGYYAFGHFADDEPNAHSSIFKFYPQKPHARHQYWQCVSDDNLNLDFIEPASLQLKPLTDEFEDEYIRLLNDTI